MYRRLRSRADPGALEAVRKVVRGRGLDEVRPRGVDVVGSEEHIPEGSTGDLLELISGRRFAGTIEPDDPALPIENEDQTARDVDQSAGKVPLGAQGVLRQREPFGHVVERGGQRTYLVAATHPHPPGQITAGELHCRPRDGSDVAGDPARHDAGEQHRHRERQHHAAQRERLALAVTRVARLQKLSLMIQQGVPQLGKRRGGGADRGGVLRSIESYRRGLHQITRGDLVESGRGRVRRLQRPGQRVGGAIGRQVSEGRVEVVLQLVDALAEGGHDRRGAGAVQEDGTGFEHLIDCRAQCHRVVRQFGHLADERRRQAVRVRGRIDGQVGRDPDVVDQRSDLRDHDVVRHHIAGNVVLRGLPSVPPAQLPSDRGALVQVRTRRVEFAAQSLVRLHERREVIVDPFGAGLKFAGGPVARQHLATEIAVGRQVQQENVQGLKVFQPPQLVVDELDAFSALVDEQSRGDRQGQHEGERDDGELLPDSRAAAPTTKTPTT